MDHFSFSAIAAALSNLNAGWILALVAALTIVRYSVLRGDTAIFHVIAEYSEIILVAATLVWMIVRPFGVQAFYIPSPSMEPTLLGENGSGDRILVNKFSYRTGKPKRDDVVVFVPPYSAAAGDPGVTYDNGVPIDENGVPVNFIKRLIGAPGDTIEAHAGVIFIDGVPYDHFDVRRMFAAAGLFGNDVSDDMNVITAEHHVKFLAQGIEVDGSSKLVSPAQVSALFTSDPNPVVKIVPGCVMRNGRILDEPFAAEDPDYDLKIYNGVPLKADEPYKFLGAQQYTLDGQSVDKTTYDRDDLLPTGKIPAGHFFMMGDNRNDSKDSTVWGPLDARCVVGQAQLIIWPLRRAGIIR